MPTLNPRISVTLTPATAAVLRELSNLNGESQSAIVGQLVEMSAPVLERVVAAMHAASTIQASAKAEIASGLERAQGKLEDQFQSLLGEMDETMRPLMEAAEGVTRRTTSGVAAGRALARTDVAANLISPLITPVSLTGGSGHPKQGKNKGGKGVKRGRL